MKTEEVPAQLVLANEVWRELGQHWDRPYDMNQGLGWPNVGDRIVIDLRTSSPSAGDIMDIDHWVKTGEEQPPLAVMLNNLVVSGRLPGALYVVVVPYT